MGVDGVVGVEGVLGAEVGDGVAPVRDFICKFGLLKLPVVSPTVTAPLGGVERPTLLLVENPAVR